MLPLSGAQRSIKLFPLVISCRMTGAIDVFLMDGTKPKNILLALLLLESKYNPIKTITADAGSNLISVIKDHPLNEVLTASEQKIFHKLRNVKNQLANSQRHNFVERRIRIFKQYLKSTFKTAKNEQLPLLSLQKVLTSFNLICRQIN